LAVFASVDHGFVVLANPKAASTALERTYARFADFTSGSSPRWKHLTWRDYREIFGDYFERNGCQVFAVVRPPFELLGSWWRYRQRPEILDPASPVHQNRTSEVSFIEWLHEWGSDNPPPRARIRNQKETLCDDNGEPAAIRFIDYSQLPVLCAKLNELLGRDIELVRANTSPSLDLDASLAEALAIPRFNEEVEFYNAITTGHLS